MKRRYPSKSSKKIYPICSSISIDIMGLEICGEGEKMNPFGPVGKALSMTNLLSSITIAIPNTETTTLVSFTLQLSQWLVL